MLHDWDKVQTSPVFTRGFKPMEGHNSKVSEGGDIKTEDRESGEKKIAVSSA